MFLWIVENAYTQKNTWAVNHEPFCKVDVAYFSSLVAKPAHLIYPLQFLQ